MRPTAGSRVRSGDLRYARRPRRCTPRSLRGSLRLRRRAPSWGADAAYSRSRSACRRRAPAGPRRAAAIVLALRSSLPMMRRCWVRPRATHRCASLVRASRDKKVPGDSRRTTSAAASAFVDKDQCPALGLLLVPHRPRGGALAIAAVAQPSGLNSVRLP